MSVNDRPDALRDTIERLLNERKVNETHIAELKTFNFERMLDETAFTYPMQETGEDVPVPFSELIKHAKLQDADLVNAGKRINELKAQNESLEKRIVNLRDNARKGYDEIEAENKKLHHIVADIYLTLEHGDGKKLSNIWRLIQPVIDERESGGTTAPDDDTPYPVWHRYHEQHKGAIKVIQDDIDKSYYQEQIEPVVKYLFPPEVEAYMLAEVGQLKKAGHGYQGIQLYSFTSSTPQWAKQHAVRYTKDES